LVESESTFIYGGAGGEREDYGELVDKSAIFILEVFRGRTKLLTKKVGDFLVQNCRLKTRMLLTRLFFVCRVWNFLHKGGVDGTEEVGGKNPDWQNCIWVYHGKAGN